METIRVLLVDDQKLFVDNLKTVLELTTKDIRVVGVAYDGGSVLSKLEHCDPEIVLMDIRMPGMDGVAATRAIRKRGLGVKILVLTTFDDDELVRDALSAGADGYVLENIAPDMLIASIRAMQSGNVLISSNIAHRVFAGTHAQAETYYHPQPSESADGGNVFAGLTPREKEVVDLIALAYSNREIAERIGVTEQTVKNYLSRIYEKLGVSRRSQLMRLFNETYDQVPLATCGFQEQSLKTSA